MRRTYRSKKDTGGALDHRDVFQNMDEKSSAFDAFYIQNIKQAKRELSCVASSNRAAIHSKRVRKKKYVKRIVKEEEPVRRRETLSSSAYLTPDKSMRVNKVLDPFDMLLNSSPANVVQPRPEVDAIFVPKKESKTYVKKRRPKIKKFNYSSSDSSRIESDKENTIGSNVTDLRNHELLVEKVPIERPKNSDESIQKIFSKLPLLCNFKTKTSNGSFNTSYKNKNRSKTYMSPVPQKSPLCSTPFKEKYRGVSIFKFSPITQKGEQSPVQEVLEENNDSNHSIILVSKSLARKASNECKVSNLVHISNISLKNDSNLPENNDNISVSSNKYEIVMDFVNVGKQNKNDSKLDKDSSSLQMTDVEPFLGFSNKEIENLSKIERLKILSSFDKSQETSSVDKIESKPEINKPNNRSSDNSHRKILEATQPEPDSLIEIDKEELSTIKTYSDNSTNDSKISINSNKCNTSNSSQSLASENDSLYDTCNSEQSSIADDHVTKKEPLVVIEKMNDTIFFKYYEKIFKNQDNEMIVQTDDDDFKSLACSNEETSDDLFDEDPNITSTTEYVVSNKNDDIEEMKIDDNHVSFVTTRRRNEATKDSMFIFDQSYGSSSTECDKTVLNKVSDDNCEALENIINENNVEFIQSFDDTKTDNINVNINIRKSTRTRKSSMLSTESNDKKFIGLKSSEGSTNIRNSRISTRKSSRISKRKSSRLHKRSYSISSESENEKTILDTDDTVVENRTLENVSNIENKHEKLSLTENISVMNIERSSLIGTEAKAKPGIVLQPGKKWERSLSIYRRMTMAEHVDHSILEESMQNKGRKYRQSVIITMEMQEGRDSLHNDSINSRRSTFVSNPSRPTIRFVKDPNLSRLSVNTSSVFDDLKGFLSVECDDTVIELSKLSIADSEHEVTILDNFHETERVTTSRDFVLRRCNQTEPILFDECYPETVLKNCHKIGEGVYGEVFLWRGRDGRARVMKIVPIAGTVKVNGEAQKDFHEIISEIVIAMELSALRAPIADIERQLDEGNDIHAVDLHQIQNATDIFNEVLAVRCVHGPYPSRLLDLWELYDECKGSENDNPAALPADQRYIVLELANAGQDLESYQFASAQQAHALFQQLAFGLAVGEEAFQFEHRDLHWGNVLIAPTEQKLATFVLRGRTYRVPRRGVAATVIDYSLSRVSVPLAGALGARGECAALYNDLAADDQLFDAVGDYQFEVYRLMREKLGNDWKNFEPYTNILWLHYIVDKMITALRYKRTNTKIHKHYIEKLTAIKNSILDYGSAVQFVLNNIDF